MTATVEVRRAGWTGELWSAIEPIHLEILQHPFITGLTSGELAPEAFVRFLQGSHSGVVGLPLFETRALLVAAGLPLA